VRIPAAIFVASTLRLWRVVTAIAALSVLPGCVLNGDFGRMRPSLVHDDVHAWMGAASRGTNAGLSRHQLTEDERLLRDLAYPLIEPPYDRNKFYSVLGEIGFLHRPGSYPDRKAYSARLFETPYRSQTARYNKLIEDIRNDEVRLAPFYRVAGQVADADRKRGKGLAYLSNLTAEERSNAVRRIEENAAIVRWVQESLRERVASYGIALERLVIAAPSPNAVEAERSLALLQQGIGAYGA
jgi:hypothetical protein